MERCHGIAEGGEGTADLTVAAFGHGDLVGFGYFGARVDVVVFSAPVVRFAT